MGLSMYNWRLPPSRDSRLTGLSPGSRADPDLPIRGWPGAGEGQEEMKGTTCSRFLWSLERCSGKAGKGEEKSIGVAVAGWTWEEKVGKRVVLRKYFLSLSGLKWNRKLADNPWNRNCSYASEGQSQSSRSLSNSGVKQTKRLTRKTLPVSLALKVKYKNCLLYSECSPLWTLLCLQIEHLWYWRHLGCSEAAERKCFLAFGHENDVESACLKVWLGTMGFWFWQQFSPSWAGF